MATNAPGKHFRKGISWIEVMRIFPDDAAAEAWFVKALAGGYPLPVLWP
jgi:hypothetical protein